MNYTDLQTYLQLVENKRTLSSTLTILSGSAKLDSFTANFKDTTDPDNVQTYQFSVAKGTVDQSLLDQVVALFTANVQTQIATIDAALSSAGITES